MDACWKHSAGLTVKSCLLPVEYPPMRRPARRRWRRGSTEAPMNWLFFLLLLVLVATSAGFVIRGVHREHPVLASLVFVLTAGCALFVGYVFYYVQIKKGPL